MMQSMIIRAFAANAVILANIVSNSDLESPRDRQAARKARQQAGKLALYPDNLRRYRADLVDFLEDFGGLHGHNICVEFSHRMAS